jgi:hypothetical protein
MPYIPTENKQPPSDIEFKGDNCFTELETWLKAEKTKRPDELVAIVNLHYIARRNPPLLKVWLYKPAERYQRAS